MVSSRSHAEEFVGIALAALAVVSVVDTLAAAKMLGVRAAVVVVVVVAAVVVTVDVAAVDVLAFVAVEYFEVQAVAGLAVVFSLDCDRAEDSRRTPAPMCPRRKPA